jgi:hypothetical protein
MARRYGYLRDPLFVACLIAYLVNRFWIREVVVGGFWHSYFNDLICVPFSVPIMVTCTRWTGLRKHDDPPRPAEILVPLVVVSAVFEVLLPIVPDVSRFSHADPWDVVCYAAGATVASVYWRLWYGSRRDVHAG